MPVPLLVFAALAGVEAGKAYFQSEAASEQENALEMKSQLQLIQYQQKKLSTYDLLQKTLATQTAEATVRGVTLDSPSFNAIQRNTENAGSRMLRNDEIESNILSNNIRIEKSNVQKTLYAQLFGDATELGLAVVGSPGLFTQNAFAGAAASAL